MHLVTPTLDVAALGAAWSRFKSDGDPRAREALILHYTPDAEKVAAGYARRLPDHVAREDLVSYALIGLVDAIERFNPALGFKFTTFANPRIAGQIVDELRHLDWVPRSVRTQLRDLRRTRDALCARLGREATQDELAASLGWPLPELRRVLGEEDSALVYRLDYTPEGADPGAAGWSQERVDRGADPEAEARIAEVKTVVAEAMSDMPEREAAILALYYIEGLTQSDIGRLFGVTESRICQMHTRAIQQVRARLAA